MRHAGAAGYVGVDTHRCHLLCHHHYFGHSDRYFCHLDDYFSDSDDFFWVILMIILVIWMNFLVNVFTILVIWVIILIILIGILVNIIVISVIGITFQPLLLASLHWLHLHAHCTPDFATFRQARRVLSTAL